jgi:predicted Zn-dependent protease
MKVANAPESLVEFYWSRIAEGRKEYAAAIQHMQKALAAAPSNIDYRKRLAMLLAGQKQFTAAAELMQKGLKYGGKTDPEYLHQYGTILLSNGNPAEAAHVLELAIKYEHNSSALYWSLAQAYERQKKSGKANAALQNAMRLDPKLRTKILN